MEKGRGITKREDGSIGEEEGSGKINTRKNE